jgi:sarcosine oxidase, subunit alpha
MSTTYRLENEEKDCISNQVNFTFNGEKLIGYENEPIAAALMANGIKVIRNCEVTGEPRGVFCGIGHCFECRAEINGIPNVRTCITPLTEDTEVYSTPSWVRGNEK